MMTVWTMPTEGRSRDLISPVLRRHWQCPARWSLLTDHAARSVCLPPPPCATLQGTFVLSINHVTEIRSAFAALTIVPALTTCTITKSAGIMEQTHQIRLLSP